MSAALLTCEDAIARAQANGAGTGVGLRGGSVTVASRALGYHLTLHDVRWTEDVAVSGDIDWPGRSGVVHATSLLRPRTAYGASSSCNGPRASPARAPR